MSRNFLRNLVIWLSISGILLSSSDLHACDMDTLKTVNSLKGLPFDIQKQLGRGIQGLQGIADKGEEFNATDVIENTHPMRRFVLGGTSSICSVAIIENGGRGYFVYALLFVWKDSSWQQEGKYSLKKAPESLKDVAKIISDQQN